MPSMYADDNKSRPISFLFSAFSLAAPKNLDLGGMVPSISDAPTAPTFPIVDQFLQWDIYEASRAKLSGTTERKQSASPANLLQRWWAP